MLQITNAPVDQIFALALQHHQAGRLPDAEALYRRILEQYPAHADALHLLGVLACQFNQHETAMELIAKAIAINPNFPAYHSNLGEAYRRAGQFERATICYRQALALDPCFADAYINLGVSLLAMENVEEAREVFATGARQCPSAAQLHRHLGDISIRLQRCDQAIEAYRNALLLDPLLTEAQYNLGGALLAQGRPEEAVAAYQAVIARRPDDLAARISLAQALASIGRPNEAFKMFASILERDPRHTAAMEGQANIYRNADFVDDAIRMYRKALEIKPGDGMISANFAFALRDYAQLDEALGLLRGTLDSLPTSAPLHSAYIFTMLLHPRISPQAIAEEQHKWNQIHVEPFASRRLPHSNDRTPGRRLKIGYVSADLRHHPVGRFMMPLLSHHDRSQVEIFCYSAASHPDAITAALQQQADHWRQVSAMHDEALAALVRQDAIDILIDLGMHSLDNRLTVFALKPAPVQMTYLAYCGGPGVQTIDYRLTDRHADPAALPGQPATEAASTAPAFEKPLQIETYWCYAPNEDACDVTPSPWKTSGQITFGNFNYFSKVNRNVLDAWARLLCDLPGARLMLHVPKGSRWAYVHDCFAQAGVAAERVLLVPRIPAAEYFRNYGLVDIALDTFPFAGGTTTCDALWMGVPVITLAGETTMSRGGASILSTVGLPELIAHTPEEYHCIAVEWARDLGRLASLRATLRQRMRQSPLMDAPRFARSIEQAYRTAWKTWCEGGRESPALPPA